MLWICDKKSKASNLPLLQIYPIREKGDHTRQALIICNTEFDHLPRRDGSNHDIIGMKGLLEDMDYSVHVKENLTAKAMELMLRSFAARPERRSSDSTFLVFMSHGILDGICGTMHSDEKPDVLSYDTIFQIFNSRNCSHLKDKPKVIIIQACRGANSGELWVSDSPAASADSSAQSPEDLEDDGVHKTHMEKDFIAFCSSTPPSLSSLSLLLHLHPLRRQSSVSSKQCFLEKCKWFSLHHTTHKLCSKIFLVLSPDGYICEGSTII
ncbi:caspase-4-like isoform X2 [Diceros bicornis minor]|uniref:caspase-4-like isoform X2 n=1 Tax=Diceros bicornis minor TaxID=77932 RepID=UPI0026EF92DE|nr:caspase-4-like isoform X2 [Diceros bicornis minor]